MGQFMLIAGCVALAILTYLVVSWIRARRRYARFSFVWLAKYNEPCPYSFSAFLELEEHNRRQQGRW